MSDEQPAGRVPLSEEAPDYSADRKVSRVYRFDPASFTWDGVPVQRYKPEGDDWQGIVRQVIIGFREQTAFHLRYFEIAPGGHSSFEKHEHTHAVMCIRGRGKAVMGTETVDLRPFDTVYISPLTPHQFINDGDEPFGFLCAVDAVRDRPQPV